MIRMRLEKRPSRTVARDGGQVGRSPGQVVLTIECPFCGARVRAHTWSLAGSGKLCACGAKHDRTSASKLVEVGDGGDGKVADPGTCASCETRRRAGLDGECPTCAYERTRAELRAERGGAG